MTPELRSLKRATAEMVRGVGGFEAAAGFCRAGKSVLAEQASDNHPERFAAIDVVMALEPLARGRDGWPHVTSALCRANGGTFVLLPETPGDPAELLKLIAMQAKEAGEIANALCIALADGKVEPGEATDIRKEVKDLLRVTATLDAALAAIEAGRA